MAGMLIQDCPSDQDINWRAPVQRDICMQVKDFTIDKTITPKIERKKVLADNM